MEELQRDVESVGRDSCVAVEFCFVHLFLFVLFFFNVLVFLCKVPSGMHHRAALQIHIKLISLLQNRKKNSSFCSVSITKNVSQ